MSKHNSAVFNNSCLKTPRNPTNKQPYPIYEQKIMHQIENEARKLSLDSNSKKSKRNTDCDNTSIKSFIDFYDSIPEYDDVNHLSNRDFYRKLENLKEKQRSYFDYLHNEIKYENKETPWIDDYKHITVDDRTLETKSKKKSGIKSFCTTPTLNKIMKSKNDDSESIASSIKEIKPPSRRSVRIESPELKFSNENTPDIEYFRSKSRADISSAESKRNKTISPYNDSIFDELSFCDLVDDQELPLATRSAPSSPRKPSVGWKDCGITIPKPFQMTVRDEENKIVEDVMIKTKKPYIDEKQDLFRANPIPIESQIPLFEKIMYDQEKRRQVIKKKSKQKLQSQMRPFSFTKREEEIQSITNRLSKSTPSLFLDDTPVKVKQFKAKPVPKNLFSNYFYKKMHEDEFYRALQKKIRSEEMLKVAALPPSMAKREKTIPKNKLCPRIYRDLDIEDGTYLTRKPFYNKEKCYNLDKELAELELDFILATPSPKLIKVKTRKKGKKGLRKSSAESGKYSMRSQSALESINRSNLAAVLRIQSARKRMECEMSRRLEECKIKDEARWREKVLRQRPVWQMLAYSHEEDLNMRLQLRRDEERLRHEEHRLRMQSMLGRVNQQPTLFERQSKVKNAKTREELISKLYKSLGRHARCASSADTSEQRSVVEMKDECIQAQFDEIFKNEENVAVHGESEDDTNTEVNEKDEKET